MQNVDIDLYRYFNAEGKLLYIGISQSSLNRHQSHCSQAKWTEQIAKITINKFSTRKEALVAEKLAIQTENPLYNVKHNPNLVVKAYLTVEELRVAIFYEYISPYQYKFYMDIRSKRSIYKLSDKQESFRLAIEKQIEDKVRDKHYIKEEEYWAKVDARYKRELGVEPCQNKSN